VFFSETRAYMALAMGAAMAVIMLAYMRGMYKNRRANLVIVLGGLACLLSRGDSFEARRPVTEVAWMKAMISHHSIAILTSERARISEPRFRKLADQIIESQRREIEEMKALIEELENR
jgi:uncharacterized protein (DUF305 family)